MAKEFLITVHDSLIDDTVPITIWADDESEAIREINSYKIGKILSVEYIPTVSIRDIIINFFKDLASWHKSN